MDVLGECYLIFRSPVGLFGEVQVAFSYFCCISNFMLLLKEYLLLLFLTKGGGE